MLPQLGFAGGDLAPRLLNDGIVSLSSRRYTERVTDLGARRVFGKEHALVVDRLVIPAALHSPLADPAEQQAAQGVRPQTGAGSEARRSRRSGARQRRADCCPDLAGVGPGSRGGWLAAARNQRIVASPAIFPMPAEGAHHGTPQWGARQRRLAGLLRPGAAAPRRYRRPVTLRSTPGFHIG